MQAIQNQTTPKSQKVTKKQKGNRLCSIELNKETQQDHFVTDASPEEVKKRLKKVGERIWNICETQQLPSLAERMVPDQNMAKKNCKK